MVLNKVLLEMTITKLLLYPQNGKQKGRVTENGSNKRGGTMCSSMQQGVGTTKDDIK